MAKTIDERIVKMSFDNSNFKKNATDTISVLDKFKSSFNFKEQEKGVSNLQNAFNKFDLAPFKQALESVGSSFSALEVAGITAISNITNKAVDAGISLAKSLSIDQITAGFNKYTEKTSSVQTLVNSTGKSVEEIEGYLSKLMWFSDETSYGFTDMTKALATMTSSGGDMDKLIPMIEGIANATAYAGKGANEFSRVIYNLNQSYGQGFLSLMDWKSVENAGASSKQLKEVLIETAEELGTVQKGVVDIGNFNTKLSEKFITSEVMEKGFAKFAELTEAAYAAVEAGQFDTASEAIEALSGKYSEFAERAFKSAQEAKSFTEAIDATKDAVSSGWMETFNQIFGNYEESKALWTDLTSTLWELFASGAEGRNNMLTAWKEMFDKKTIKDAEGNEKELLTQTQELFYSIEQLILTVRDRISKAWEFIFPENATLTASKLFTFIQGIINSINDYNDAIKNVKSDIFLSIEKAVKGIAAGIKLLLDSLGRIKTFLIDPLADELYPVLQDIFIIFGNLGLAMEGTFKKGIKDASPFVSFLKKIVDILKPIIGLFKTVTGLLVDFSEKIKNSVWSSGGESNNGFSILGSALTIIEKLIKSVSSGITGLVNLVHKGISALQPLFDKVKEIFTNIKEGFGNFLSQNGSEIGNVAGFGILGYFIVNLTGLVKKLKNFNLNDIGSNFDFIKKLKEIPNNISDLFKGLKTSLEEFTNAKIKTDMIKTVAVALLELAVALAIISSIDEDKLWKAVGAMAALAAIMAGFIKIIDLMSKSSSGLSSMTKGLEVSKNGLFSKKSSTDIYSSIVKIAAGFLVLAIALKILASIDMPKLASATVFLGLTMLMIFAFIDGISGLEKKKGTQSIDKVTKVISKLGFALIEIALALKIMSTIDIAQMGVALLGLVVTLGALFGFIVGIDKLADKSGSLKMAAIGAAVVGIGLGLLEMAAVLKIIATMKIEDLLVALGGILGVLGTVLLFTIGISKLASAVDFAIISASMILLGLALIEIAAALKIMQTIPADSLGNAVGAIGAIVGIMGLLTALLGLTTGGLGVALFAGMAASMILLGAGLIELATALAIISALDPEKVGNAIGYLCGALAAVAGIATGFGLASPLILGFSVALLALGVACKVLGVGLLSLAKVLVVIQLLGSTLGKTLTDVLLGLAEAITAAFPVLILGIVNGILDTADYILQAIVKLITIICNAIIEATPKVVETFVSIFKGVMSAITQTVPELISTVTTILLALIEQTRTLFPEFIQLGWDLLKAFLQGIADNLGEVVTLITTIISTMVESFISNIPTLVEGFWTGIINCINGLADLIREKSGDYGAAVANLCGAIVEGIVTGIGTALIDIPGNLLEGLGNGLTSLWNRLTGNDDDDEVSKGYVKTGEQTVANVQKGMENKSQDLVDASTTLGEKSAEAMEDAEGAKASGQLTIDGLLLSLKSQVNLDSILEAGKAAGAKYMEGYNSMMNINSPSKEMEKSGKYTIQGLLAGLEEGTKGVKDAAENTASNMLNAMRNAVDAAMNLADEDLNPVITPVLDLSKLEEESGKIGGMLGTTSIGAAGSISRIQNGASQLGNINNNNVSINVDFSVNNAGRDLTESDINKFGSMIADKVNRELGLLM